MIPEKVTNQGVQAKHLEFHHFRTNLSSALYPQMKTQLNFSAHIRIFIQHRQSKPLWLSAQKGGM